MRDFDFAPPETHRLVDTYSVRVYHSINEGPRLVSLHRPHVSLVRVRIQIWRTDYYQQPGHPWLTSNQTWKTDQVRKSMADTLFRIYLLRHPTVSILAVKVRNKLNYSFPATPAGITAAREVVSCP